MGLIPEQSFTVRTPAWHGEGTVLADYPGRAEAMALAGHDWDVVEATFRMELPNDMLATAGQPTNPSGNGALRAVKGWKCHVRSDNLGLLHVSQDSFTRIQNSVAYDVAELLFDQGFLYETAGTMDGGKLNYITLLLPEPVIIANNDSTLALPYGCLAWAHDGTAALSVSSGTIVQVCQNTMQAAEIQGNTLGTRFTFRHTKNVMERINDAREVIRGLREGVEAYREVMEELVSISVTPDQRDLFVSTIIGDTPDKSGVPVSMRADTTDRVKNNIEAERAKILGLFGGPTVPEQFALTAYGCVQAGGEYFDHLRRFNSKESYVKRTLIQANPAKANLQRTIREIVALGA